MQVKVMIQLVNEKLINMFLIVRVKSLPHFLWGLRFQQSTEVHFVRQK